MTTSEKAILRLIRAADQMPEDDHVQATETPESQEYEAAFNDLRDIAEQLKIDQQIKDY